MSRAGHKPTAPLRQMATALSGYGIPHTQIAILMEIDAKTLRLHYRKELDKGDATATAEIAKTLYQRAIGGELGAMIFWLKARAGWREVQKIDHTGSVTVTHDLAVANLNVRAADLTIEQRQARLAWLEKRLKDADADTTTIDTTTEAIDGPGAGDPAPGDEGRPVAKPGGDAGARSGGKVKPRGAAKR